MKADRTDGAVYVITQNPRYIDLLLTSATSLKRSMPELPITVFTQFPVNNPIFDQIIVVDSSQNGFYDKVDYLRQTPYEKTLFIDADTYVVAPIPELFNLLDRFDCAATHEEYLSTDWFGDYPREDIPESFPEFNTGILLFRRSEKTDRLLENWKMLYEQYSREKPGVLLNDQPFFRVASYHGDVRIATLTREYNCKFRGQGYLNGKAKILHGHVDYQLQQDHIEKAEAALNKSNRPRVYVAGNVYEQKIVGRLVGQRIAHKVGKFPELPGSVTQMRARRLREIVKQNGIKSTLAKILTALR